MNFIPLVKHVKWSPDSSFPFCPGGYGFIYRANNETVNSVSEFHGIISLVKVQSVNIHLIK